MLQNTFKDTSELERLGVLACVSVLWHRPNQGRTEGSKSPPFQFQISLNCFCHRAPPKTRRNWRGRWTAWTQRCSRRRRRTTPRGRSWSRCKSSCRWRRTSWRSCREGPRPRCRPPQRWWRLAWFPRKRLVWLSSPRTLSLSFQLSLVVRGTWLGVSHAQVPPSPSRRPHLLVFLYVYTAKEYYHKEVACRVWWPGTHPHRLQNFQLYAIVSGSCHEYHFCRDKTCLSSQQDKKQKYACRDKSFVVLSQHVCRDKSFVSTSILLSQQKTCFVTTNTSLSRQKYACCSKYFSPQNFCHDKHTFCHDKRHVLSQQTCLVCCNKNGTFRSSCQFLQYATFCSGIGRVALASMLADCNLTSVLCPAANRWEEEMRNCWLCFDFCPVSATERIEEEERGAWKRAVGQRSHGYGEGDQEPAEQNCKSLVTVS